MVSNNCKHIYFSNECALSPLPKPFLHSQNRSYSRVIKRKFRCGRFSRFSAELDDVLQDIQDLESPNGHSNDRTDDSSDSDAASMKTTKTVILNGKNADDLGYVSMRHDCAHLLSVYDRVECELPEDFGPVEANNNTIGLDVVRAKSPGKGWKSLSVMLKRKHRAALALAPEIEASIVKSECLAYLSDKELVERYDRNKMVHRVRRRHSANLHGDIRGR